MVPPPESLFLVPGAELESRAPLLSIFHLYVAPGEQGPGFAHLCVQGQYLLICVTHSTGQS